MTHNFIDDRIATETLLTEMTVLYVGYGPETGSTGSENTVTSSRVLIPVASQRRSVSTSAAVSPRRSRSAS